MKLKSILSLVSFTFLLSTVSQAKNIVALPTPNAGIAPYAVADAKGVIHLTYAKLSPEGADAFYVSSTNGGKAWSEPVQVNRKPHSVIAGAFRCVSIAMGRQGRLHAVWLGKDAVYYTRSNESRTAFEEQRNVMQVGWGPDGPSVAADQHGNVLVTFHAMMIPRGMNGTEQDRRVVVASSSDDGKTFAKEKVAAAKVPMGPCACCGTASQFDQEGIFYAVYRDATQNNRDMYLLISRDVGRSFTGRKLSDDIWIINACPMAGSALFDVGDAGVLAAWETKGQVFFQHVQTDQARSSHTTTAPGPAQMRRFPTAVQNAKKQTLLAWRSLRIVAWQVYDSLGQPMEERGEVIAPSGVNRPAAVVVPDGTFYVLY